MVTFNRLFCRTISILFFLSVFTFVFQSKAKDPKDWKCDNFSPSQTYNNVKASNLNNPLTQDTKITGTLTIDQDLTMSGADVQMGTNAEIIVKNGKKLTIQKKPSNSQPSHLFSCTKLWNGITLKAGSELDVNGNSLIEDAEVAILSENQLGGFIGNGPSDFTIKNARLNKNYKHLVVENALYTHPGYIANTNFTSKPISSPGNKLLDPRSGQISRLGVKVDNVLMFNIGDPNKPSNNFSGLRLGILADSSSIDVKNNSFNDIRRTTQACSPGSICLVKGRGILFRGTATSEDLYVGGNAQDESNTFKDCYIGVKFVDADTVQVINNNFDIKDPGSDLIKTAGGFGVSGKELGSSSTDPPHDIEFDVDIKNNHIKDHMTGIQVIIPGIDLLGNQSDVDINNNTIENPEFFNNEGIILEAKDFGYGQHLVESGIVFSIQDNTIKNSGNGIRIRNIDSNDGRIAVTNNQITLEKAFGSSVDNTGIRLAHFAENIDLKNNQITGPGTGKTNLRGVYISQGFGNTFCSNTIENTGQSMVFEGNCHYSNILSNTFDQAEDGFVLLNNGVVSDQGAQDQRSGNVWDGGFSHAQTYSNSSDGSLSEFFVKPRSSQTLPTTEPWINKKKNSSDKKIAITPTGGSDIACPFGLGSSGNGGVSIKAKMSHSDTAELLRIVRENMNYPYYPKKGEWLAKYKSYLRIKKDSALPGKNVTLASFEDSCDKGNIGLIRRIDRSVASANFAQAEALKNALVPSNDIEANFKQYFGIHLQTTAIGKAMSSAQKKTMFKIAKKCPMTAGPVVYRARTSLDAALDSTIHWSNDCPDDTSGKKELQQSTSIREQSSNTRMKVRSSALEKQIQVRYDIGENKKGGIRMMDLTGRVVQSVPTIKGSGREILRTGQLSSGVYVIRIRREDGNVLHKKFIVR